MRKIIWFLVGLLALVTLASSAFAQDNGVVHPPTGSVYELRYTAQPNSEEVCLFKVDAVGTVVIVDEGNPLACTNAFVADGATVNVLQVPVSPSLGMDTPVALRASRTVQGVEIHSALSNWHELAALLGAPVLLP